MNTFGCKYIWNTKEYLYYLLIFSIWIIMFLDLYNTWNFISMRFTKLAYYWNFESLENFFKINYAYFNYFSYLRSIAEFIDRFRNKYYGMWYDVNFMGRESDLIKVAKKYMPMLLMKLIFLIQFT